MSRTVVITGASSGLGRATAAELAAAGFHVVLACRSVERGMDAAAAIRDTTPAASFTVLELDLASLGSVRSAAETLLAEPVHALICNAGIQVIHGVRRSADGYELTFATNHLGHFLLAELLAEHLTAPGRVVVVSSGTHYGPTRSLGYPAPRWADPHTLADPTVADPSPRAGRVRYATSKLANLYHAYELSRRLADREITVNAYDPGLMPQTGLDRDYPPRVQRLYARLTPLLIRLLPGASSVAAAAADLAWLTTAPELSGVTGAYFVRRRRTRSSRESYDAGRAARLWQASTELVTTIPPHRAAEIDEIIDRVTRWAATRYDVVGVLLVGSVARDAARPGSDVDIVLLTRDTNGYAGDAWAYDLAIGPLIRTRSWGALTEKRFATPTGLEVELGIVAPSRAAIDPVDPGTRKVITDGARILHDPVGLLAKLLPAG